MEDRRIERGLFLANRPGSVTQIDENTFTVRSENHLGLYRVYFRGGEWTCECQDHKVRRMPCKHIYGARFFVGVDRPPSPTFFDSRPKDERQMPPDDEGGRASMTQAESPAQTPRQGEQLATAPLDPFKRHYSPNEQVPLSPSFTVTRLKENGAFRVSSSVPKSRQYEVLLLHERWFCSCRDFQSRTHYKCVHIHAVTSSLLDTYMNPPETPESDGPLNCPKCGSTDIADNGHTKKGKKLYHCKDGCNDGKDFYFREPSLWLRARFEPEFVIEVLDLYFGGAYSLRKVRNHIFRIKGVWVSHQTIWKWMAKLQPIIELYCSALRPNLSGIRHVDEMAIKVKGGVPSTHGTGQWQWRWLESDRGTKLLVASELTRTKNEVDGFNVLNVADDNAKEIPAARIHDKLATYPRAAERRYIAEPNPPIDIAVMGGANGGRRGIGNQQAERVINTLREPDKVRRGLKTAESPIPKLEMVFYNHVRPNMSLPRDASSDKMFITPGQAAGLGSAAPGRNKLLALVENALIFRHHATSSAPAPPMK